MPFLVSILLIQSWLAWEPSGAQGTHSYSRRLPALVVNYDFSFFPQMEPLNLLSKLRTFLWVSRASQSKCEADLLRGFWVMIVHKKNRDYNFIYKDLPVYAKSKTVLDETLSRII